MDILDKPFKYAVKVEGKGDTPQEIVEVIQDLPELFLLINDLGGSVEIQSKEGNEWNYLKIIA